MSPRLIVDNTRPPQQHIRPTDCFVDDDGRPIAGTPPPEPCPFCGSGSGSLTVVHYDDGPCPYYAVDCTRCGCEGPGCDSAVEAAQGWNRRAEGLRS